MLTHPTLEKLHTLKWTGMASALSEQMALPDIDTLSFEERLGLLIDREITVRENRRGYTALYQRLPRLLQDLALAKGDGRYPKLLANLAKTQVLILDDRGLAKLTTEQRRDLLEILEDRHGYRSTLATSQLPVEKWHDTIGDPTLADAILDRLVHNAYKINLKGESMRKLKKTLTTSTLAES